MEAVILMGIQGAGKSTFYTSHFFHMHIRLSLDLLKTRGREQAFMRTCFETGQCFVVDNTNVRAAQRAFYIAAAKQAGFRVKGYFLESPLSDALRRNAGRSGKALIPVPGVIGTFKRLERPSLAEGFDELYVVTHGNDGRFLVNPWQEQPVDTVPPAGPEPETTE